MRKYVQHISGQGEKWEVWVPTDGGDYDDKKQWLVKEPTQSTLIYYLPRSEYREVLAPEKWVDVTEQCSYSSALCFHEYPGGSSLCLEVLNGYRLIKRNGAFYVEKKVD